MPVVHETAFGRVSLLRALGERLSFGRAIGLVRVRRVVVIRTMSVRGMVVTSWLHDR